jgi:hypothetical protein
MMGDDHDDHVHSLLTTKERFLPPPTHPPTPRQSSAVAAFWLWNFLGFFFVGVHVLPFQELSGSLLPPVLHFFFGDFYRFCVLCPIYHPIFFFIFFFFCCCGI